MTGAIRRNDWSAVAVPDLGSWVPTLRVSVVVPAHGGQEKLDLVLASLAYQSYPADLFEVIVVDDGSPTPLRLADLRPAHCRLISAPEGGWGAGHAVHHGVLASTGDIVHRLDADMLVHPWHIEAQARWHHAIDYAVTLGTKRFVDVSPDMQQWPKAEDLDGTAAFDTIFRGLPSEPHDYIEEMLRRTANLQAADHLVFMAHVGATAAMRRSLYDAAGPVDARLHRGQDTEFGYRLAQAGAVFVPEEQSRAWHLGRSGMMVQRDQLRRFSRPFLAQRMPHPRWLRRSGGSAWEVPLAVVVMDVRDLPAETALAAADSVLRGSEKDLRLHLIGPWDQLDDARRSILDDDLLDARVVHETYRGDPRVRLVTAAPASAFPSPYLIEVPPGAVLPADAVAMLVSEADRVQAGLVEAALSDGRTVRLWRTAAVGRAQWTSQPGQSLTDAVEQAYGVHRLVLTGGWTPTTVEVGGLRSLAKAAAVVVPLSFARMGSAIRRSLPSGRKGSRHG